jgi:hypothetical protein
VIAEEFFPGDDREGGFIVLHRRIESWPLWESLRGEQRHVVTTILLLANWKTRTFWYGSTPVEVRRGELAHSLEAIASRAGVSTKVARTVVGKLLAEGFLGTRPGTESGTGPRILIIRNYERYQSVDATAGTPPGTGSGKARARRGHASGTAGALREPREPREQGEPNNTAPADAGGRRRAVSDMLVRVFGELNPGAKYDWRGTRDGQALTALLVKADDARIEAMWRRALQHRGFPTVSTIHGLNDHWNEVQALRDGKRAVMALPGTVEDFAKQERPF